MGWMTIMAPWLTFPNSKWLFYCLYAKLRREVCQLFVRQINSPNLTWTEDPERSGVSVSDPFFWQKKIWLPMLVVYGPRFNKLVAQQMTNERQKHQWADKILCIKCLNIEVGSEYTRPTQNRHCTGTSTWPRPTSAYTPHLMMASTSSHR